MSASNLKEYAAEASKRKATRRANRHALAAKFRSGASGAPNVEVLANLADPAWKAEFAKAMQFAYYEYTDKELKVVATSWMKSKGINLSNFSGLGDYEFTVLGEMLWVESIGGKLDDKARAWIAKRLMELKTKAATLAKQPAKVSAVVSRRKTSDEIESDNADRLIQAVDSAIDDWLIADKKGELPTVRVASFAPFDASKVYDHFLPIVKELTDAAAGKDASVAEGYKSFSRAALVRLCNFMIAIMKDLSKTPEKVTPVKKAPTVRKARAPKPVSPIKLVARLKYKQKDDDLKVTSVRPENLVGADQLWVFNTKYRSLGVYHAATASGLSVKGQTIQNFDPDKSVCKTVRKPDVTLALVLSNGKIDNRKVIPDLRAVERKLNGRIGEDTILLKVYK